MSEQHTSGNSQMFLNLQDIPNFPPNLGLSVAIQLLSLPSEIRFAVPTPSIVKHTLTATIPTEPRAQDV